MSIDYQIIENKCKKIFKLYLQRKYFLHWRNKVWDRYAVKKYETFCQKTPIKYLETHNSSFELLSGNIMNILGQLALLSQSISQMFIHQIFYSKPFEDLIRISIRRGVKIHHWCSQLKSKLNIDHHFVSLIQAPRPISDTKCKEFQKKVDEIWRQEVISYMSNFESI